MTIKNSPYYVLSTEEHHILVIALREKRDADQAWANACQEVGNEQVGRPVARQVSLIDKLIRAVDGSGVITCSPE